VAATSPITAGGTGSTITVTARDASGNPIQGATVVLAASGTGNTLTQPAATTNASGVATGTLSSTVAESKTVSATVNAVAITQTATVVVNAGTVSAAQSTVAATSPITAGGTGSTITVTAKDQFGNLVQGATVVLAATGTGNTLTQPAAATNASGVATGTLSSTVAESKTVSATAAGTAVTQQTTVTVNPAAASRLTFTGQPSNTAANAAIAPPVVVTAQDAFGNTATTFTGSITLSITSGTGTPLAVLSGTNPVNAAGGVATFSNLSINLPSTVIPYQLDAASGALTRATSSPFNITP